MSLPSSLPFVAFKNAHSLCWQGIENKRTRELSEDELTRLRDEVDKYTVEGDLRRFIALNIKRLKEIQCYRGKRHIAVSTILLPLAYASVKAQTKPSGDHLLNNRILFLCCSLGVLCRACLSAVRPQRTMHALAKAKPSLLLARRSNILFAKSKHIVTCHRLRWRSCLLRTLIDRAEK
jgi:hypothetical protein